MFLVWILVGFFVWLGFLGFVFFFLLVLKLSIQTKMFRLCINSKEKNSFVLVTADSGNILSHSQFLMKITTLLLFLRPDSVRQGAVHELC